MTPDAALATALARAQEAPTPHAALAALDDVRAAVVDVEAAAVFWFARSKVLVALGRVDDAIADADRAVSLEPGVGDLVVNLAGALVARFRLRGDVVDLQHARRALEEAVRLGPLLPEVRSTLAVVLDRLGEPARAVAVCDDNLAAFVDDAVTLFNKAAALKSLGRSDDVRAILLALAPRFPPAAEALTRLK
jgi:predicted Zn-dependent protease